MKSVNMNWLLANGHGGGRSSCFRPALGCEAVFSLHEEFPNVLLGSMRVSAKASKRGDWLFRDQ